MANCGDESGHPIYHQARSKIERRRSEPGARVGDTEWGICNKYNISYDCFRKWNNLPPKHVQASVVIQVGRSYIVGYQPVVQPQPQPQPQPTWPQPQPQPTWPQPQPQPVSRRRYAYELTVSDPCVAYMKSWERPPKVNGRISGQVFRDTKGSLTIGYGHYIKEEEKWNWAAYDPEQGGTRELSIAEMEALFRQDVQRLAEADVKKRFSVPLLQQEYDALVDFTFHRGAGALRDSDLEGYINSVPDGNFDYGVIQDNFMKYAFWFNRNTNQWEYVEGFAKRRREEIDMFRYGRYTLHS